MKEFIRAFEDKHKVSMDDGYFVFLFPGEPDTNRKPDAFMPKKRQYAFMFTRYMTSNPIRTLAHELSHGAYRLSHPWELHQALQKGTTANLMDYVDSTRLYQYQWNHIHNPPAMIGWMQDDVEGESYFSDESEKMKIIEGLRYAYRTNKNFNYIPITDFSLGMRYGSVNSWIEGKTYSIHFGPIYQNKVYSFSGDKDKIKVQIPDNDFLDAIISFPLTNGKYVNCNISRNRVDEFLEYLFSTTYENELANVIKSIPGYSKNVQLEYLYSLPSVHYSKFNIASRIELLKKILPQKLNYCGPNDINEIKIVQNLLLAELPESRSETSEEYLKQIRDNDLIKLTYEYDDIVSSLFVLYKRQDNLEEKLSDKATLVWDTRTNFSFKYYTASISYDKVYIYLNKYTPVSSLSSFVGGGFGSVSEKIEITNFDPLSSISVIITTSSGAMRGYNEGDEIKAIPGFFLCYLIKKETEANEEFARNFFISISTAGIGIEGVFAAKGIVYFYRISQIGIPIIATLVTAPEIREEISKLDGGEEFIDVVNQLNLFVGVVSAAELAVSMPKICKSFAQRWKNIRNQRRIKEILGEKNYNNLDNTANYFDEFSEDIAKLNSIDNVKFARLKKLQAHWETLTIPATQKKIVTIWRRVPLGRNPVQMHPDMKLNQSNRYSKEMKALYFGESKAVSDAEWLSYNKNYGLRGETGSELYKITMNIEDLLDLTDPTILEKMNIELSDIVDIADKSIPQAIGSWAIERGYKGIRFPSARMEKGVNIVIFKADNIIGNTINQELKETLR